jgi:hypothetical protein
MLTDARRLDLVISLSETVAVSVSALLAKLMHADIYCLQGGN